MLPRINQTSDTPLRSRSRNPDRSVKLNLRTVRRKRSRVSPVKTDKQKGRWIPLPNPDNCCCPPTPSKRFRFTKPIEEGEERDDFRDRWRAGESKRKREQKRKAKAVKALRSIIRKVKERGLLSEYSSKTDINNLRGLLRKRRGKSKTINKCRKAVVQCSNNVKTPAGTDVLLDNDAVGLEKVTRQEVCDEIATDPIVVLDRHTVARHLAKASKSGAGGKVNRNLATRRIHDEYVFVGPNGDEVQIGYPFIDEEAGKLG